MSINIYTNIIDIVKGYLDSEGTGIQNGLVRLVIDSIIVLAVALFVIVLAVKYFNKKRVILGIITLIALFAVVEVFDLTIARYVLYGALIVVISLLVNSLTTYFKSLINMKVKTKNNKNFVFDEEAKKELIDTLIKTVEHLSSRKIGGIITIEKENTLNSYIDKAVRLDADVSYELLNTIFHPNTALHDGAVIIRGNRILCASAFYPSSDKADIPQYFGSRHRAAIGISEVSDAFTIVVSEETGKIATTIGGTISENNTSESLRATLEQHIIVQ